MMLQVLQDLIAERGVDLDGKIVLQAQLSLKGGMCIAGAITIEEDDEKFIGHSVGAVPLNPQDPRAGMKIIEQFFDVNSIEAITVEADAGLLDAYKALWEDKGRSKLAI